MILIIIGSILLIFALLFVVFSINYIKNRQNLVQTTDFMPCLACYGGYLYKIDDLTENLARFRCYSCGAELITQGNDDANRKLYKLVF